MINAFWPRWDKNADAALDRRELVAVLKDPTTRNFEAGIAVVLYEQKYKPAGLGKPVSVSKEELLTLVKEPKFAGEMNKARERLTRANRALFTKDDPNLDGFHQGATGDCFLLANLALLVQQRPEQLRAMFTPLENRDIRVTMGDGQAITVSPLTDSELLLGAAFNRNSGVWLSVFEKAYAQIWKKAKERNVKGGFSEEEAMHSEFISGGLSVPTMQTLTGHKAIPDGFRFGKETKEQEAKREELHTLLTRLMKEKKLVLLHTRRDPDKSASFVKPPGWPDAHTFALFGYDPEKRIVHCFNPWGNTFKPKGESGLANGYETKGGQFDMPLAELMALFKSLSYETDEVLASATDAARPAKK
ncbi:MAG: hypothetical protein EBS05_14710 [Proteobacteria bacterium]|nr:hypothetical protein [Pseudomonadota bacterium]